MTVMTSGSMSPALQGTNYESGDRIVLEKVTGRFRAPKRWEVYFFYNEEGTPVAKRIVGLPGERISVKKDRVYVNGQQISVPERLRYLKYLAAGNVAAGREVDCGKDYYVLGDDSGDSYDSRFTGPVAGERFRGRVWYILWPKSRIGFVQ
jgi:signal peptidase I